MSGRPAQARAAVASWVRSAVAAREQVLVRTAPGSVVTDSLLPGPVTSGVGAEGDPPAGPSQQVRPLDATRLRDATGGRADALCEAFADLADQARRAGWAGLAVTGDAAALRATVADDHELWTHERDLERLTRELPLRVLCCYGSDEPRDLLAGMAGVHHRCVTDVLCCATQERDCLWLSGEIDISNADRLAAVLHAGRLAGTRCVELSAPRFCGAAGLDVLVESAAGSAPDRPLVLRNPTAGMDRVLRMVGLDGAGSRIETDADPRARGGPSADRHERPPLRHLPGVRRGGSHRHVDPYRT